MKTWGGVSGNGAYDLVQTDDGGYAVTSYTQSYGAGSSDIFLAKYDANGNLSWNKLWSGASTDYGQSLVQTSDGGYAVTGLTMSYGAGSYDMILVKYDANCNLSWNKLWGGVNYDNGYSLVQVSDGGYVVTGQTNSYGAGDYDTFLAKYDINGNLSWSKTWGGASTDYGQNLAKTSDGGFIITGHTASYGAGSEDMFLAKYDSSGNLSWSKTWGGTANEAGYSLVQTSDNGCAIVGYTMSYGAGAEDIFLIKYNASGDINNCISPMCQTPIATVTPPSASVSSPSSSTTIPSATVTTPSATITSPSATATTVVAP